MTRYLLDTNIVSEIIRPVPSVALLHWLDAQDFEDLFISAMTMAEIERGILTLPDGEKRAALEKWFEGELGPRTMFAGRIIAFEEKAASHWARLIAEGRRLGRPRNPLDMIIAATAEVGGCMVATANERDFVGIPHINPTR